MAVKIPISFKETEKDMYEFVLSQLSSSIYIKGLIKKDMETNKISTSKVNTDFGIDF